MEGCGVLLVLLALVLIDKVCGHTPASRTFWLVFLGGSVLLLLGAFALAGPHWPPRPP
jgi:hypothetical protein